MLEDQYLDGFNTEHFKEDGTSPWV